MVIWGLLLSVTNWLHGNMDVINLLDKGDEDFEPCPYLVVSAKTCNLLFQRNPDPPTFSPKQQNDGVINHKWCKWCSNHSTSNMDFCSPYSFRALQRQATVLAEWSPFHLPARNGFDDEHFPQTMTTGRWINYVLHSPTTTILVKLGVTCQDG